MPRIEAVIEELKAALLSHLPGKAAGYDPAFSRPPNRDLGDLSIAVFPAAKSIGRPPHDLAREWAAAIPVGRPLAGGLVLESCTATGGFLNLRFEAESLLGTISACVTEEGARYGGLSLGEGRRVMVEYSSPNTNKPQHLGHVRNDAIGMSLSSLLEAAGYDVIRTNLVNDRGIHICKSMLAYRVWGGGETPETTGEKGDHFVGRFYVRFDATLREERASYLAREGLDPKTLDREASDAAEERFLASSEWMRRAQEMLRRWEEGDPETLELWKRMNAWVLEGFRRTYDRLGCRFDRWYFESETWMLGKSEVDRGLASGVFHRKEDGSVWAPLESIGLQDKILLRSDGTSVYITQDIGTAILKQNDFGLDRSLYVVGAEQVLHFKNLFAILRLLGHAWADGCHHVSYGLVTLPRGMGKLKSREGTAVDADDLLDLLHDEARRRIVDSGYCGDDPDRIEATAEAIGQGALKVYLLQVGNDKNIVFDPEERLSFEGDTGPAIQYSHARICGIVRKGIERGVVRESDLVPADDAPAGVFAAVRPERIDYALLSTREERDLALQLLEFPLALALGCRQLSAAPIATYLLDLTRCFARFYHEQRVLDAPDDATRIARLHLCLCVAQVLRRGLKILAVEAPDRM